jgi:ribosomal protein S18 acetylase RimI-like enzyme
LLNISNIYCGVLEKAMNLRRFQHLVTHLPCRRFFSQEIVPYAREKHAQELVKIAQANIEALSSHKLADGDSIVTNLCASSTRVMAVDGKPVGFIRFSQFSGNISHLWLPFMQIDYLAVHSSQRGRGHARALINSALSELNKETRFVTLQITQFKLLFFYHRFGFNFGYGLPFLSDLTLVKVIAREKQSTFSRVFDRIVIGRLIPLWAFSFAFAPLATMIALFYGASYLPDKQGSKR